jgi:hypothetical protein
MFPDYVDDDIFHRWYLSLYRFATEKPFMYFDLNVVDEALTYFNRYPDLTIEGVTKLQREVSHAVFSLLRPGTSWTKENPLSLKRPEKMLEFERVWHPEYQRYCEHVFNHLIQVPLYTLGKRKSKNYLQPPLANRAERLEKNGLGSLTHGYDSIIRNAISHGSTAFELGGLRYTDRHKPDKLLVPREFAKLFDNLIDTCHSLLIALLLFVCSNRALVEKIGIERLPLGLRFILIDAFVSHPDFDLLSMTESNAMGQKKQLNIVCKIGSRARWAQMFEGMHVCWKAATFGGRDYQRFAVSFDCGMPVLSTLILDGERLQQAIHADEPLSTCAPEIIETPLLWYDASFLGRKIYAWKSLLPLQWKITKKEVKREIIKNWHNAGLKVLSSRYTILKVKNKSSNSIRLIEAHLILHETGSVTDETLQDIIRHAVRKLRRHRVQKTNLHGERGWHRKPDYIRIRMYTRERRIRTLLSYGWKNEELVLIAEWLSSRKLVQPFHTQKPDVISGNIRIKYNPQLVKTLGISEKSQCTSLLNDIQ